MMILRMKPDMLKKVITKNYTYLEDAIVDSKLLDEVSVEELKYLLEFYSVVKGIQMRSLISLYKYICEKSVGVLNDGRMKDQIECRLNNGMSIDSARAFLTKMNPIIDKLAFEVILHDLVDEEKMFFQVKFDNR